jgi:hypothetical protein
MDGDEALDGGTKERTAHHEAGHAVAGAVLGLEVAGANLKVFFRAEWRGSTDVDTTGWEQELTVLLAGGAGEARFNRKPAEYPPAATDEWDEALGLARKHSADEASARQLVDRHWGIARQIVGDHQAVWGDFAAELQKAEHLGHDQCEELLAGLRGCAVSFAPGG